MAGSATTPSTRERELLEAAYQYALSHGLADISLRPLATAIGSSPRVLLFLFGSKDGLVQALLARARQSELDLLRAIPADADPPGLDLAVERTWEWLRVLEHRPLLRLWAEAYTRSLVEPEGAWADFATSTVNDWLDLLRRCQPVETRDEPTAAADRTLALAVLRGALLHLLATNDEPATTAAVQRHLAGLRVTR